MTTIGHVDVDLTQLESVELSLEIVGVRSGHDKRVTQTER